MSQRQDDSPQIIGEPPTAVRPGFDLEPDAVHLMLTAGSVPRLLELLGLDERDRAELAELLPRIADDKELLTAVTEVANLLRQEAGLNAAAAPLADHAARLNSLQEKIVPGQGLLAVTAHLVSTDVVRAWHRARGVSDEQSWLALSDLGQQMRVHRRTFGELGHHTLRWTALNWAGRLFWLGRLQFDLHLHDERWRVGTHIPATGPLEPAGVEESFEAATVFFGERFCDLAENRTGTGDGDSNASGGFGREFVCHSWLVNAELTQILGADSNLGAFAARWEIETTFPASDDAVFFVFNRRPPYEPSELPRDTRLREAIVDRLLDGRGWTGGKGRLRRA